MYEHGESGFDELVCNEFYKWLSTNTYTVVYGCDVTYVGKLETVLAGKEAQLDQGANDQNDKNKHNGRDNANAGAGCQDWKWVLVTAEKAKWNV